MSASIALAGYEWEQRMPRYFFNVFDGQSELDEVGTELADEVEARKTALRFAGEILDDAAHRNALGPRWHMEVADDTGLVLFRFDFRITDESIQPGGTGDPNSGRAVGALADDRG